MISLGANRPCEIVTIYSETQRIENFCKNSQKGCEKGVQIKVSELLVASPTNCI